MTQLRHALSDAHYAIIEPLLPPSGRPGHPWKSHRSVIDGILRVLHTGAQWRDLPRATYGPWQTVYERFNRWTKDGTADAFVAAEDLTCQPGLALQQDTALVLFHGIPHAERNGHHYVDGFADTPQAEARAFLAAHPDLYEERDGIVRLVTRDGKISTGSLRQAGFASGVDPAKVGVIRHNETQTKEEART